MKKDFLINSSEVNAYTIPTDFSEADGTLEWNSTTIIIVTLVAENKKGIGYTYATTASARIIQDLLFPLLQNKNPLDIPILREKMYGAIRNNGRYGICSMAISAVDNALWDLKAKLLNVPLVSLLGKMKDGIPVYGSGGFTTYSNKQMEKQFSEWMELGIKMFKMKIGRSFEDDKKRIAEARKIIGSAELFIDANGAYSVKQAIEAADYASQFNVKWFEEPVSSDNLEGLNFLREKLPMNITAGEYGYDSIYFRSMLEENAVDVLQLDATRCGGISGFLEAAVLSKSFFIPASAHTAPSVHIAPCCSVSNVQHIEYFHDHARIEKMFFDGVIIPKDGILYPDLSRNGIGIELKEKDAEKFKVGF